MSDATSTSPTPRPRRRWLRALVWIVAIFVVLLVVVYFVGTSSAFVKRFILPKAGAALNATVTVSEASVSPFSQVILRDLKVQTTGTEPLVTAPEVRLRYSLMDIIRGNIRVEEVSLKSPTVTLVENPDGSRNLDPILKAQQAAPAKPAEASKPSKPAQIDVKSVALSTATLRRVKLYAGGRRDLAELSNLNLNLQDLKNGQTGKLTVTSDIKMDNNPPAPATNRLLEAKLNGNFSFALTPELKPASAQGSTRLEVTRAGGSLAQAAALVATLDCDVTPTDIKQAALRFQKGDTRLGELRVSGPFDLGKMEGRFALELLNIDKNLLNLAGASSGLDFGPTKVSSTNLIQLAKGGASVAAAGQFNLNSFQVTRTNQTTPPLDLRADYDVTVDSASSNALVKVFNLTATQNGNQFLRGELSKPMPISWGTTSNAVGDAALNLVVSHLDLANWKAFAGEVAPAGDVNAKLQLLSKLAGKQLAFDLDSEIANLTAVSGSNRVTGATVTLRVRGQADDLKKFDLPEYKLNLALQNQPLVTLSGSGVYDTGVDPAGKAAPAPSADMQLDGQVMLARLLKFYPQPGMDVSAGTAQLKARFIQRQNVQDLTGNFTLADFTGQVGSNSFRGFGTTADLDIGVTPQQVQIRKLTGRLTEGATAGGSFDVRGTYNLTNKSTQVDARLAGFNQAGLRAFLEPSLGDKKLVSVALNGSASAQYDPQGASSVKADLQVINLVVNDPKGQFPAKPLEARLQVDASLTKQVAEVHQLALGLTPTDRATNRVQLSGRVDMTQSNNIQGNLRLAADSLDLTSYYDLFAAKSAAAPAQTAATPATAPSAPPAPEKEPEPTRLPFTNFTAEAAIGKLFLHEVAISNLQATTRIDGGHVVVNPFKLALNGAPMNTTLDLNLGVPGYKYDLSASALAIPLAPLVNTFQPDRKGQIGGTLTAQAKIAGTGTTGANLQKYLASQFDITTTNLNLSVVNLRNPMLRSLINVVALIPDLVRNPDNALGSLVGALVPRTGAGRTGGLASELEKSPIDQILLRGSVGSGKVDLQQAFVQSAAFQALATGNIRLEAVLTNSALQIPVGISLSRSVADHFNLVPANAPTNLAYVKLPDFVTMRGTVGQPKTDINKLALAGTVFRSVSSLIPGGGGQTGNLIQNLLGGGTATGTNAPASTNRPAAPTVGGLLQGLLGGTAPAAGTNAPAKTNAPSKTVTNAPATNPAPLGTLLDELLGPKKK